MTVKRPRRARSFYERALTEAEQDALEEAREVEGMDDEVALLRTKLRALLAEEPLDTRLFQSGLRLLLQALATRHRLDGRHAEGLSEAVADVVEEFGALLAAPEEASRG